MSKRGQDWGPQKAFGLLLEGGGWRSGRSEQAVTRPGVCFERTTMQKYAVGGAVPATEDGTLVQAGAVKGRQGSPRLC